MHLHLSAARTGPFALQVARSVPCALPACSCRTTQRSRRRTSASPVLLAPTRPWTTLSAILANLATSAWEGPAGSTRPASFSTEVWPAHVATTVLLAPLFHWLVQKVASTIDLEPPRRPTAPSVMLVATTIELDSRAAVLVEPLHTQTKERRAAGATDGTESSPRRTVTPLADARAATTT